MTGLQFQISYCYIESGTTITGNVQCSNTDTVFGSVASYCAVIILISEGNF